MTAEHKIDGISVTGQEREPEQAERAEKIGQIYQWSSQLTAEIKDDPAKEYYPPKSIRKLIFKLNNIQRGLIGVIGLQGTGKTHAARAVKSLLADKSDDEHIYVTWKPLKELYQDLTEIAETRAYGYYVRELMRRIRVTKDRRWLTNWLYKEFKEHMVPFLKSGDWNSLYERAPETCEKGLSKSEISEIKREAVFDTLSNAKVVFIDMPDYDKRSRAKMVNDLDQLYRFWTELHTTDSWSQTTLVIFIQKELFHGHFFFGKMDVIELEPFNSRELVEIYEARWKETYPYKADALLYLADLSRGIFRRFLKYIQLTLELRLEENKQGLIDIEIVKKIITTEQIIKDMKLELADVFASSRMIQDAVRVLRLLWDSEAIHQSLDQKQISKELQMTEARVSRILSRLEQYRYIERRVGEYGKKTPYVVKRPYTKPCLLSHI